jgi:CspA family cold shock protein
MEEKRAKLKWFNTENGYGFLIVEGHDKDVFLHIKQLRASGFQAAPSENDQLTCVVNEGPKGSFATNITKV